jgi:hypothetical protein
MRAGTLVIGVAVALLAGGCRGAERVDTEAARALVRESRAVEARLAAGDTCAADMRASELRRLADRAIAAGLVPVGLAPELQQRTRRLAAALTCPPPPPPAQAPPAGQEDQNRADEGERGNGQGKSRGKRKGHED